MADDEKTPSTGVEEKVMLLEEWVEKWEEGDIKFHVQEVNPFLAKHADRLLEGRTNIRIFVPLCGKAVDIKWLSDQGHTVVGIEFSEQAIKQFFEEQKLEFTKETVANFDGQLFKSQDDRIRLYCGDVFAFNKGCEAEFDGIWDRGSLVAINRDDRQKYSTLLTSLMARDCVYLLDILQYDQSKYSGPPHSTTLEEVQQLYGVTCTINEIDSVDIFKEEKYGGWGIDWLLEKVMLIKMKK